MNMAPSLFREELDRFAERYRFTARERDVVVLLVTGSGTVPSIAAQLGLSQNTIHNHFKNVFRRTRTNTKPALLALFVKEALDRQAGIEPFLRRPRVLVVEPHPLERERMVRALQSRGMETRLETDSTQVLERISKERIDVVVADVTLPGTSGRGVLDDVTGRFGRHPGVLLTTVDSPNARAEWLGRGAGALLAKPIDTDELVFCVIERFADSPYERSRLQRVDTELAARLDEATDAQIGNVGFGGAFVALRETSLREAARFAVGSRVRIEFDLEDRKRLDVQGEVRWRRDSGRPAADAGIGVQFVDMRHDQRELVEHFVRLQKLKSLAPLDGRRRV
jgi:DNA-binding NarL/FixJ family response regulator/Tfp pilus assembly protein PilZ